MREFFIVSVVVVIIAGLAWATVKGWFWPPC